MPRQRLRRRTRLLSTPRQQVFPQSLLHAVVIRYVARTADAVPTVHGRQAHAAFLAWMRAIDPSLSAALHSDHQQRPFTLAFLPGSPERPGELQVRISFLSDILFHAFMSGFEAGTSHAPWRFGATDFAVAEVSMPQARQGWSGQSSWQQLVDEATDDRRVSIEFATPTSFSLGESSSRRRLLLFPLPAVLWASWHRRWDELAPAELSLPALSEHLAEDVLVSDYTLRTATIHMDRFKHKGFTGTIRYEVMPHVPTEVVRALNALAAFSFFSGSGAKTAMGLGLTRLSSM